MTVVTDHCMPAGDGWCVRGPACVGRARTRPQGVLLSRRLLRVVARVRTRWPACGCGHGRRPSQGAHMAQLASVGGRLLGWDYRGHVEVCVRLIQLQTKGAGGESHAMQGT